MLELLADKKERKYLLTLLLFVIAIKIAGLLFVLFYAGTGKIKQGTLHRREEIIKQVEISKTMLALGYHWDCIHYVNFAHDIKMGKSAHTYPVKNYGIVFPLAIAAVSYISGSEIRGAVIVANLFSILAVFAFYFVCRLYLDREKSLAASMMLASFPSFFASGIIAYSDSLFLFFAIISWYFFAKDRFFLSAIFAGLCVCTRTSGMIFAVAYPLIIIFNMLRFSIPNRRLILPSPGVLFYIIPFAAFLAMTIITRKIRTEAGFTSESFIGFIPVFNSDLIPVSSPWEQIKYFISEPTRAIDAYMYLLPALILAFCLPESRHELQIYTITALIAVLCISKKEVIWAIPRHILNAWPFFIALGGMMENKSLKWVISTFFLLGGFKILDGYFTNMFI